MGQGRKTEMTVIDQLLEERNEYERGSLSEVGEKILRLVLTRGFVTAKDVEHYVWPGGVSRSNLYRALRRLVTRGLIEPLRMEDVGVLGWRVTKEVQSRFCEMAGLRGAGQYRLFSLRDSHDRHVRRAAARLSEEAKPEFIAHEGAIRTHLLSQKELEYGEVKNLVPDLLMGLKGDGGDFLRIAVEIELSAKGRSRRRNAFDNKLTTPEWSGVLYLLGNRIDRDSYRSDARHTTRTSHKIIRAKTHHPVLFVTLDDFDRFGIQAKGIGITGESTIADFVITVGSLGGANESGPCSTSLNVKMS